MTGQEDQLWFSSWSNVSKVPHDQQVDQLANVCQMEQHNAFTENISGTDLYCWEVVSEHRRRSDGQRLVLWPSVDYTPDQLGTPYNERKTRSGHQKVTADLNSTTQSHTTGDNMTLSTTTLPRPINACTVLNKCDCLVFCTTSELQLWLDIVGNRGSR